MSAQVHKAKARDHLTMTEEEIWQLPEGWYDLEFDNGEVVRTTSRRCIYSWYCWDIHRIHQNTDLLPKHHVCMRTISRTLHTEIMGLSLKDCRRKNNITDINEIEKYWKIIFESTNRIWNSLSYNLEEYVTSISATDISELLKYPPIKKINDELQAMHMPDESVVTNATKSIEKILTTDFKVSNNPLARAVLCGSSRVGQVLQILGPIGHRTDVNGKIYEPAITRGYGHGMLTLRDSLIESRDACRNLFFQGRPMQISEWSNRIIQLMVSILSNLHHGDCGSTDYLTIDVTDKGVLKDIVGSNMWDEEIKMLRPIERDDTDLIGKKVKIRNIITCKHDDRYGFCSTCYGELYYNIPKGTNIGHVAPTEVLGPVGQLILSQKHYNGAATSIKFNLTDAQTKWLEITNDGLSTKLSVELRNRVSSISFKSKEIKNMLDLGMMDDEEDEDLDGEQLSALSNIVITYNNGVGLENISINLSKARNLPVFSNELIKYIRFNGWYINEEGRYEIDMTNWNYDLNILDMPLAQFSAPMYMKLVQEFICGTDTEGKNADNDTVLKYDNLGDALISFRNIIALKLNINITQLAIILQATKIANVLEGDYRPPVVKSEGVSRKFNELMAFRSAVAGYAYQYQKRVMFKPESFLTNKRPPHYLDYLMKDITDEDSEIQSLHNGK